MLGADALVYHHEVLHAGVVVVDVLDAVDALDMVLRLHLDPHEATLAGDSGVSPPAIRTQDRALDDMVADGGVNARIGASTHPRDLGDAHAVR